MSSVSSFSQNCIAHELTSFRKAVACNNKESIEKHLSHMKSISEAELNSALFSCIQNFRIEEQSDQCLFLLLRNKANPNCEINGQTPLIAACKIAQITMVKHLVQNGAKPDLCNSEGRHPLEFILSARKQNYDVAQYIIGVIASVNIEMGKSHVLVVAVEKEFLRIFKMLIEKGATLLFGNEETILHVIMKKKFKDARKKKKFIKQLANRSQLSQIKDKQGKLAVEYETDEDVKNYYQELFKPKLKAMPEKEHHLKNSIVKENSSKDQSKEKQHKRKGKEEEPSSAVEEEGVDQEQNEEEGFNHVNEQDKEKIVEVIEEDEQERKNEEERQKLKRSTTKILTPAPLTNNKRSTKTSIKPILQKSIVIEKVAFVDKTIERDKIKKINNQRSKKQLANSKKSKSFTTVKKYELEDEKKEDDGKKKTSLRGSVKEQESNRKPIKKDSSDLKLQSQKEDSKEDATSQHRLSLDFEQEEEIKKIMIQMLENLQQKQKEQQQKSSKQAVTHKGNQKQIDSQQYSDQQLEQQTKPYNLQQHLTQQILAYAKKQNQQYLQSQQIIHQILNYLQNKMKLCIESHIDSPFTFKIQIYGSQATALAVDQSDIDLLVISNLSIDLISMFEFYRIFQQDEIIDVKFIKSATMPVIKLTMGELFHSYKVDLTFQFRGHTGLRCAQLIEQFKTAEPLLRPLVVNLKRIIYKYNLADPYTGGLGSYSLTLMVIALLQFTQIDKTEQNLGKLFMQFLLFYGFQLNYVCQSIIIHLPGYNYKQYYSIYQLPNTLDLSPKLVIYDPMNPVNNVGRTTYRIECLKNLFKVIYLRLMGSDLSIQVILQPQFMDLIHDTN